MRSTVKFRIIFLALAIISFTVGVNLTPEAITSDTEKQWLGFISLVYFILLPLAYWYCIIKVGGQKLWKMLMIFGTSSLVARLSFPDEIAHYFEFIAWLRYPIIGVLLVIELYLVFIVIRGLIKVRHVKGDPRVAAVEAYSESKDKELAVALVVAGEATNWYYAVPWFSREHQAAITHINLYSAARWHLALMLAGCLGASMLSYYLLVNWSEIVAVIVSSIISLSLVMLTANHRVARHYSVYSMRNKLIVNNAMWGFLAIDVDNIDTVEVGSKPKIAVDNEVAIGRGEHTNISIRFKQPQLYFGGLGQLVEKIDVLHLCVAKPELIRDLINNQSQVKTA